MGFGSFWLDIFDSYPAGDVGADTRKAILFIVLRVYISAHLDRNFYTKSLPIFFIQVSCFSLSKVFLNPLRKFDSLLPVFRRRSILERTTNQLPTYSLLPKWEDTYTLIW